MGQELREGHLVLDRWGSRSAQVGPCAFLDHDLKHGWPLRLAKLGHLLGQVIAPLDSPRFSVTARLDDFRE